MLRAFVNCAMVLTKHINFLIQVINEYSSQPFKLLCNCQKIFYKTSATLPLIKIYRMSLISVGSISLDITFKEKYGFGKLARC